MRRNINKVQNNQKPINIEEIKIVCEELYKTFIFDTSKHSNIVKKYATIFENEIV